MRLIFSSGGEFSNLLAVTIASVHDKLTKLALNEPVFVKDFAYSIIHLADDRFLNAFTHTFLIRDPEKVITSMYSRWPDISLAEIGFEDLRTLFDRIADRDGQTPPVIDSDELLQSPHAGMAAYCAAVGLSFLPDALNWEDKKEKHRGKNPTWNTDEEGFHDSLRASTELKKQKRHYPPLTSSVDMIRLYEASMPHYEALSKYRLPISPIFDSGADSSKGANCSKIGERLR